MESLLQRLARPEILALKTYSSARMEMTDSSGMIQLDANENPFLPYPQTKSVDGVNRYPEPQPKSLLSKMANLYQVKHDQVLVTRGMDEVIDLLIRVFCIPYKDNIVITPPTFGYYKVAADIAPAAVKTVPLDLAADFALDSNQIINICDTCTKIVFLCSPNNPTGTLLPIEQIEFIVKNLPEAIIAVDEAYLEFSVGVSAVSLLSKYPNLVVMKTLSKAYAFAGVRIGTLIAHPELINLVRKILAPYPLPKPCVDLALNALSPFGLELASSRIELIKTERERMYLELSKISDLTVYESQANFLLIKVNDANYVYQKLLAQGIVVRNRSTDIPNTLRITVGSVSENDLVLAAFGVKVPVKNERTATISRKTNETEIMLSLNLDQVLPIKVNTGIGFFDHMLEQLAKHGGFSLELSAKGDTHIDFHHTVEDVAIVLGQALNKALGDKCGIERYGFVLPMDESCAFATIDLSGRGVLVYEANFVTRQIGDFPVEMVEHFFLSFANNLQASIHLKVTGNNSHHMVEGLFKACAKALNQAISKTKHNNLPSTKGLL